MLPTTGSPSFFSHAHRPAMHPPKQQRGFLALPGEIRNQIYNYYFDRECYCEVVASGTQLTWREPQTIKLCSRPVFTQIQISRPKPNRDAVPRTVVRFSRPLGKYNVVQGLRTNWVSSMYALSLVCKQVYLETTKLVYGKTVFIFDAPKRMHLFFNVVSTANLQNITKLHLHYNTYGNPRQTDDQVWQGKHTQSW
jgi:hypothetical protein